ncbi:rhodanese-like domain-containing protein [Parasalinivibrio latis]|uniref:rhodanese-like domain-containing protein n=1 Tax=Parasalinivibrio latis TaxID=2952610 RepID=UPI003DA2B3B7
MLKQLLACSLMVISMSANASTFSDFLAQQQSPYQVIDSRDSNAFNGWAGTPAESSGHIQGAVNIDASWLKTLPGQSFSTLLKDNSLDKHLPTWIYGSKTGNKILASSLKKAGFEEIHTIDQPVNAYPKPLIHLARYQQLVPAWWIKDLNDGKSTENKPRNGYKVVEVAWGPPTKYLASHIPGALYLNTNDIEEEPLWNHVSDKDLKHVIENLGITSDTTVILYGRNNLAAARAAVLMMYAGVKDVRLLNGGWKAWMNAGYPVESFMNEAEPVTFDEKIPAKPDLIINMQEARKYANDPSTHSLVSVRTMDEYTGKTSGYDYIPSKGRIPGSKWGHAGAGSNDINDYLNPDGTMKSPALIEQFWKKWGILPSQKTAFYCGTGWRASEALFYAYVMGWDNLSLFDGGWYEWSEDKSNPIETGPVQHP